MLGLGVNKESIILFWTEEHEVIENQPDKIIWWKIVNCVQSLSPSLLVFVVGANTAKAEENKKS